MYTIEMLLMWILIITFVGMMIVLISTKNTRKHKHHHKRFKLVFNLKNANYMAIISNLTLLNRTPVTLPLTVVDENDNNKVIPGILTGLTVTSADPNADTAVINTTNAEAVDVAGVSPVGGTTVTATGSFVSTALHSDGSPEVAGLLTGTLTIVNNIVVKAALVFNQ